MLLLAASVSVTIFLCKIAVLPSQAQVRCDRHSCPFLHFFSSGKCNLVSCWSPFGGCRQQQQERGSLKSNPVYQVGMSKMLLTIRFCYLHHQHHQLRIVSTTFRMWLGKLSRTSTWSDNSPPCASQPRWHWLAQNGLNIILWEWLKIPPRLISIIMGPGLMYRGLGFRWGEQSEI